MILSFISKSTILPHRGKQVRWVAKNGFHSFVATNKTYLFFTSHPDCRGLALTQP
jgi:hypothetical protein